MNEVIVQLRYNRGRNIRWPLACNSQKEDYYFSVVDVINTLANSKDASDYWTTLKKRLTKDEESELPTKCRKLKTKAKDGKLRETDTLDTEGIFRLIESIP